MIVRTLLVIALVQGIKCQSMVGQCPKELILWTYRLGDFKTQNAHKFVARDWPFETKAKMGDVLILEDGIQRLEAHNDSIWKCLESRGYNKPEKLYQETLEQEKSRISMVLELLDKDTKVQFLKNNLLPHYWVTELEKEGRSIYRCQWFAFDGTNPVLQFESRVHVETKSLKTRVYLDLDVLGRDDSPKLTAAENFFLSCYVEGFPTLLKPPRLLFVAANGNKRTKTAYFNKVRKKFWEYGKLESTYYALDGQHDKNRIGYHGMMVFGSRPVNSVRFRKKWGIDINKQP